MVDISITRTDAVNITVHCDPGLAYELAEHFTFEIPGARFSPKFKQGFWDGKIRLFNPMTRRVYGGLVDEIEQWAKERKYSFHCVYDRSFDFEENIDLLFEGNWLPKGMVPRDYQMAAVKHAICNERCLLLSPTASGKSLIIYMLMLWYSQAYESDFKALIIVPTTSLVRQMETDFIGYGSESIMNFKVHTILEGSPKHSKADITIATWQSIYKEPASFFSPFTVVIGDEAHSFKAKSLTEIMTKLVNAYVRIGTTGTLDGMATNKTTLEGLFGPVFKVTTSSALMDQGHIAKLAINCLILNYHEDEKKSFRKNCKLYSEEVQYLINHNGRNRFIVNMIKGLEGNTMLLFGIVDHGKFLYETLLKIFVNTNRNVYLVYGKVESLEREEIRKIVETEDNAVIVASYGTFSTGTNIKRLHNVIFAHPTKSRIRTLQSIGRGLRIGENKEMATLYDIADDLRSGKGKANHTLRHYVDRMRYYNEEGFNVNIYQFKVHRHDA